ncbi:hypothetical protein CHU98_g9106 [Xylaria longipes]|nr:hypothetical protein CHU98_g9106 [Xylaria longipes]
MTFQPRHRTQGQLSRRRPLRDITDHNATRRETPLIKTIARDRIKTPPTNARPHTPSQRLRPGDVIIHQFSDPEKYDSAVRIFTRLPSITGLAGLTPRLYNQDRDRLEIQLKYPNCGIWRVVDRVHSRGDRAVARLRVHEIRQLRNTLLNDISILCASHIAFSCDISFLRIVHRRKPFPAFLPFLDAFDLNACIDWAEYEREIVRKVEAQFQVFEFLAQLESPTQSHPQSPLQSDAADAELELELELDPADALRILQANPPCDPLWCLVILQVRKYAPELARYTIDNVDGHLHTLQKRTGLPDYYPCSVLSNYSNAVRHMLLLTATDGAQPDGAQPDIQLLADRAYLWVLYAAVLVHSHVTVIEPNFSKGLLRLDGLAEACTSREDVYLVTEACRDAQKAVQTLYKAGGKLEKGARWFIRDMHLVAPACSPD